jgi:hypothetical protein
MEKRSAVATCWMAGGESERTERDQEAIGKVRRRAQM